MDSNTETAPASSVAGRGDLVEQLSKIGYFTVITVATVGWVSAFGWLAVRLAYWVMA
jgi:hypothetical protein